MRRFWLAAGLVLLIGLQLNGWQPGGRVTPALVLAGALAVGLYSELGVGLRWGVLGGALLDLYSQQTVGLFTLAIIMAYLPLFILSRSQVEELNLGFRLSLATLAAVLYELVLLVVLNLSGTFPFFAELRDVATLNVAATVGAFLLLSWPASRLIPTNARPLPQRSLSRP